MPRKNELSVQAAVKWLVDQRATITFGRKDGVYNIQLQAGGTTFIGYDLIDLVHRAKGTLWRREMWKKKEASSEAVYSELGSWLKENAG